MKVLITGGGGYLSTHLAVYLRDLGHQILLVTRDKSKVTPIDSVNIKEIDWESGSSLESACLGVNVIIHAAAVGGLESEISPEQAYVFNESKTHTLAQIASKSGVKKFIYFSTAHVYKNPLIGQFTEKSPALNNHPYAKSKFKGELAVINATQEGGMQGLILRISNIYGAPIGYQSMCWRLVVNDLCRQAIFNGVMHIKDQNNTQRDFLPIGNLMIAVATLMESDEKKNSIINIGSGFSQGVWDIARFISNRFKRLYGKSVPIIGIDDIESKIKTKLFKDGILDYQSSAAKIINFKIQNQYSEIDKLLTYLGRIKEL